jgi:hypothetical protein
VHAELDTNTYDTGVRVHDRQIAALPLRRHDWHPDWNYSVLPEAFEQVDTDPALREPLLSELKAVVRNRWPTFGGHRPERRWAARREADRRDRHVAALPSPCVPAGVRAYNLSDGQRMQQSISAHPGGHPAQLPPGTCLQGTVDAARSGSHGQ